MDIVQRLLPSNLSECSHPMKITAYFIYFTITYRPIHISMVFVYFHCLCNTYMIVIMLIVFP